MLPCILCAELIGDNPDAKRDNLREKALNAAAKECRRRVEGALETIRLVDTLFITFLFTTFVNPPGQRRDSNDAPLTTAQNVYAMLVGLAMIFGMFVMLVLARVRTNMNYTTAAGIPGHLGAHNGNLLPVDDGVCVPFRCSCARCRISHNVVQ
jgi:hypothetical protein